MLQSSWDAANIIQEHLDMVEGVKMFYRGGVGEA